ncbi:hypothetical protein FHT44_004936 [Mycolicibacterium sp. BK634]|nr:hypothetical protein [Mycolicibacterium sp. BK634]
MDICDDHYASRGDLCIDCFDAIVAKCNTVIAMGAVNLRPPCCVECRTPIEKLSDIIKDVVKL